MVAANPLPVNLYDTDNHKHPLWMEMVDVVGYVRTSPNQTGTPADGQYQLELLKQTAKRQGVRLEKIILAKGRDGRGITPELLEAVEHARQWHTHPTVWALDWTRLCRVPAKLAQFPDVTFVSVLPLELTESEIHGVQTRLGRKTRQGAGRPRNMTTPYALPFIMSNLGKPWSRIARKLGDSWTDNKVRRLFLRYFKYSRIQDSTKTPSEVPPRK